MKYPLGRGNKIQWFFQDRCINVYDHCYNSDFNSLLIMLDQSTKSTNSVVVFSPLKECADLENRYKIIKEKIDMYAIKYYIYNPNDNLLPSIIPLNNYNNKEDIINQIINIINTNTNDINIFIKGANSFNLIDIVLNLLKYLGNYCI